MIDKGIPIKNVYHMLCYAWGAFNPTAEKDLAWDSIENSDQLMAHVILLGVKELVKRGFYNSYHSEVGELSIPRGEIKLFESISPAVVSKHKLVCEYDIFDSDIPMNRILLATLTDIRKRQVVTNFNKEFTRILSYFTNVRLIKISRESFNSLIFDRNNQTYRLLMGACELYWADKLPKEERGIHRFTDIPDCSSMHKIFEKFLFYFYKVNCKHLIVKNDEFRWKVKDPDYYPQDLGKLCTDIVLRDNKRRMMLIIDAKYYKKPKVSKIEGIKKLRNSHISQVVTYMQNLDDSDYPDRQGMLIYPKTNEDIHLPIELESGTVYLNTINLDNDWEQIEADLLQFVRNWNGDTLPAPDRL